ncbi:hypothetical protein BDF20DRAFT_850689 [Mycotypha africana]|uniref:uncharacterized protein n=1 Tax=Mycotypha africana TaxID=64632 RepID=UPI002300E57C|nr:uncharacterized protein BDF20DRAFT_850689 [Mycotypha africana]KAI8987518.1 hypothetical protein BDF20DRAFT_850689 [Mycotypha africana]
MSTTTSTVSEPPTPKVNFGASDLTSTGTTTAERSVQENTSADDQTLSRTNSAVSFIPSKQMLDTYTPVRAGLPTKTRLSLITSVGAFWGFGIGCFLGAKQTGLQYLAENAHRLPTTVEGWYFYHKTKNYKMMLGGVKRGSKFALKTGGLCLMYGSIEAALDYARGGEADMVNSVVAGVTTGTVFSALTKLTRASTKYSIMFGAVVGLVTGGLSDLYRFASGDAPAYAKRFVK